MIFFYGHLDFAKTDYGDGRIYYMIADAAPRLATAPPPFAWRLLGPYIAGLLPLPLPYGFYLLSTVSSFMLAILFFFFLCDSGLKSVTALTTVVLYTFNRYLFAFSVWDFYQINDILALISILLLFWALHKNNWMFFGFVLLVGGLARETVLIMVPVLIVWLWEKGKFSSEGLRAFLAVTPGIIVFILLRKIIPVSGNWSFLQAFQNHAATIFIPETWFRLFINTFIPFSFIPIIFFGVLRDYFRENKHMLVFLVLVFLSKLCGENNERLVAPAFIVFYSILGLILNQMYSKPRHFGFFTALCVAGGFLSTFHHEIARYPLAGR